jgi:hypothetical protein
MRTHTPERTGAILAPVEDDTTVDYGTLIPETRLDRALLSAVIAGTRLLSREDLTIWDAGETRGESGGWDGLKTARVSLGDQWNEAGELLCHLVPNLPFDATRYLTTPTYPIYCRVRVTHNEDLLVMWRLPKCPLTIDDQSNDAWYPPVLSAGGRVAPAAGRN